MIQHVHERVLRARGLDRVLVATDDERIAAAVRGFGGEAVMTSAAHATGTDRLAEAVLGTDAAIVVNVQGDEPMVDPAGVEAALRPLLDDPNLAMSTLSLPLRDVEEMLSPAVVKVVADARGDALYFSRSPIPHVRRRGVDARAAATDAVARGLAHKHVGLYERAVVGQADHLAGHADADRVPLDDVAPRIGHDLLVAERDALGARIVL